MSITTKRKKAKRDNGTGSVYPVRNRWCAAVMTGKDANNKAIIERFYGATKEDAKAQLNEFLLNPTPSKKTSDKPILACDFFERWLKNKYGEIKASSFDRLECAYRINTIFSNL